MYTQDPISTKFAALAATGSKTTLTNTKRISRTKPLRCSLATLLLILGLAGLLVGQDATQSAAIVPQLVNYSGKATDPQGKPIAGMAGVTFAIYKDESGGSPLWLETQSVQADSQGNYTARLGATNPNGLPLDLFASGEARWLGVRINGGEEQARVLLLSVPYALKAADAQTLGGLPVSAFMLAAPTAGASQNDAASAGTSSATSQASSDVTTTGGTVDTLPLFTTATNVQSSILTQTGSGTTGKIGINTTTPASTLDVNGAGTIRGNLSLPPTAAATKTAGTDSQPLSFTASSYNSGTGAAVNQNFRWQAEPAGNDTASASGTLNLLYSSGASTPAETGLKIAKNGQITFASGQTFPGAGAGTITGVTAGTDLTGGGTSGNVTLNVNTSALNSTYAQLNAANTFTGNQIVNGNLTTYGSTYAEGGLSGEATPSSVGVYGFDTTSGGVVGVYGTSSNGVGVGGVSGSCCSYGVEGTGNVGVSGNGNSFGVEGIAPVLGVWGESTSSTGTGVQGSGGSSSGGNGVFGIGYDGVSGEGSNIGVVGTSPTGIGMAAYSTTTSDALFAENQSGGLAAFFYGSIDVDGNLAKAGGSFKIDDPLDPANKYLYHSFVESPDMMNVYNGNVTTDAEGNATVQMPKWFEALNRDFRYQLTVIGQFAQAYISSELENQQFSIKTDKPNVKVSWQVTGIRQDAWANAHRIPVEVEKPANERGYYMHPELFGAPAEKSIAAHRHPGILKPPTQPLLPTQAHTVTATQPHTVPATQSPTPKR
jgi:trimeric autotransporter adhesin